MRLLSALSALLLLSGALLLASCGGSDDSVTIKGTVDGCEFTTYGTSNILVGVFGRGANDTLVEVATSSSYVSPTTAVHNYTIVLGGEPPKSVLKSGDDVAYNALFIQGYVDKNNNGYYDDGDRLLDPAEVKLAYFYKDENSTHAQKGYNFQDSATSFYAQDFSQIPYKEVLVTAECAASR